MQNHSQNRLGNSQNSAQYRARLFLLFLTFGTVAIFLTASVYFDLVPSIGASPRGTLTINLGVDMNANSKLSPAEHLGMPVSGVDVILYDDNDLVGAGCAQKTSDGSGQVIFSPAEMSNCTGVAIRYEVDSTDFPNQYIVGPVDLKDDDSDPSTSTFGDHPEDTHPLVQNVDLAVDVSLNIAIFAPNEYVCSRETATAMTACYMNGDPLAPGSEAAATDALVGFPYSAQGAAFEGTNMTYTPADHLATTGEIGTVWGLSYSPQTNLIYASSLLKRHTGLGPLGLDGIYQVELAASGPIVTNWLEIEDDLGVNVGQSLVPSNSARGLPITVTGLSRDAEIYPLVAKVGLGDIDLVSDELLDPPGLNDNIWIDRPLLLAVDLFNKDVLVIDVENKSLALTYDIPVPNPVCNLGEHRPWAVDYADGKMYIGIICDASQDTANLTAFAPNNNLEAIIYEYDLTVDLAQAVIPAAPTAVPTEILRFSLGYEKGELRDNDTCRQGKNWHPWIDTIVPSGNHYDICWPVPVFSDIEFTKSGNMLLGFTDRTSHQWGFFNYSPDPTDDQLFHTVSGGDILMACPDASGQFVLENNGQCGSLSSITTTANGEGPGGSEFFSADNWNNHHETVNGGLAVLPGSSEVMVAGMDPFNNSYFSAGGINWFNTEDGTPRDPGYMLYASANTNSPIVVEGSFGKSGGLGDVDLICAQPPLNIGDYIWNDGPEDEANGVQDPDEAPIEGVLVTLFLPTGNTITTTTDAQGYFNFTVDRNQSYKITIDATTATSEDGFNLSPTIQNSPLSNDLNDSDANALGEIFVTTGRIGISDHSLDAGFISPELPPTAVELTSFTAGWVSQGSVLVEWENAAEIDNFGFKIYRSTSADFDTAAELTFVPSKVTNSGEPTFYAYLDQQIDNLNSDHWYWLVDVDTGGVETRHGPVFVPSLSKQNGRPFTLYLPIIARK